MRPWRHAATLALLLVAALLLGSPPARAAEAAVSDRVVLLHGLARSAGSMDKMAAALEENGYAVCNVDYPSRHHPVEVLAREHVLPAIRDCWSGTAGLHFVTHSLGGIIVRQLVAAGLVRDIGRVVMLGPPNRGSEVVDKLGGLAVFDWLNGPAGQQLGTGERSLPLTLGPASFEAGILAGNCSINPLLSLLIPGPDDGKVAVARARLDGMADFRVVEATHPLMMRNRRVIEHTLAFLATGRFLGG